MQCEQLNYIEKNGVLYPHIQISNNVKDDERPLGKYGMMWLQFMKEHHNDHYIYLLMDGELMKMAHNINDEAHEQIAFMVNGSNDLTSHIIAESEVVREFLLVIR